MEQFLRYCNFFDHFSLDKSYLKLEMSDLIGFGSHARYCNDEQISVIGFLMGKSVQNISIKIRHIFKEITFCNDFVPTENYKLIKEKSGFSLCT